MSTPIADPAVSSADGRAKRNVAVLVFAHAILGSQLAINIIVAGLAGAVFTKDMDRAHRFSEAIHAGTVWINTYDMSSFATPFGGFKQSGFGRDRSVHAVDKYCDYKTIWQQFG